MGCYLATNLNWHLKGNDYLDDKVEQQPRTRKRSDGECCVEKRSTQKVLKERRMKKKAKSRLRSADRDAGVSNIG